MREEPRGVHRFFTSLWLLLVELVFTVAAGAVCIAALFVRKGVCDSDVTMEGKTVIVTGSNAGIGKATAKELARRKARVILACRNLDKAKRAALEILEETQQQVVVKHLDLASFKSVRNFANDINKTEPRLDVLINNAGVVLGSKKVELTEDGYEMGFQSNYLSHVLLTMLLADLLKKSAPSRVVNVSSILHHLGKTDQLEDRARGEHPFRNPLATYCNTKLAQLFFTRALSERLKDSGVTVNAVHPGNVKTEIAEQSPGSGFFKLLLDIAGKTPLEGAQTSVYAAVSPELVNETGKYFSDCKKISPNRQVDNRERAEQVFRTTTKLVHLDLPEPIFPKA